MLLPSLSDGSRLLPDGVIFAADAEAIEFLLREAGVSPRKAMADGLVAPEDLALLAADMTVLVSCWE